MSKIWGNIGAWAAESERAEAEEKEQEAAAAAAAAAAPPQSYPSLKEAVNTSKGKKKTKMTLQEFTMAGAGSGGIGGGGSLRDSAFEHKGLTHEEMMRLPTGPKERSAEEMQHGRLGGGFSSYGGGRPGGGPRTRDRDEDGDGSWGSNRRSYGGFDDDRRGPPSRAPEYDQPSRADEVDNWAMTKKPITPSFDAGSRPNRYSSLGGGGGLSTGGGGGFSRADEIDNWTVNKKPTAPTPTPTRSSTFGSDSDFRDSGGPEPDRWSRGAVARDGNQDRLTERRRLVLDPPRGDIIPSEPAVKANKPNPFGNARPREEILAEKGLDWKKADLELEAKRTNSRPTSSHSNSRPGSAQSGRSAEGLEKPRSKVNPFGDAKPREVLLQEKGVDYRKIDLELERRRLGRPETEAEKNLKEEIDNLKREIKKESNKNETSLNNTILEKERELEQLTRDLDDKLRFSQNPVERPVSGAGRVGPGFQERPGSGAGRVGPGFQERPGSGAGRLDPGFQERPPSQSGSFDESRSVDFSERPRSRGDSWMRPGPSGDDRRGFGGGKDGGFLGNRQIGRSSSRERW